MFQNGTATVPFSHSTNYALSGSPIERWLCGVWATRHPKSVWVGRPKSGPPADPPYGLDGETPGYSPLYPVYVFSAIYGYTFGQGITFKGLRRVYRDNFCHSKTENFFETRIFGINDLRNKILENKGVKSQNIQNTRVTRANGDL